MYPVIHITPSIVIPTYFLVIAFGYILGMLWLVPRCKRVDLNPIIGLDLAMIIMVSGFLGSRALHIVWELPGYYWEHPWDTLKVWQGGFVFYGGAIAALVSSVLFLKNKKQNFWEWSDVLAPIIPLVYGVGRVATLLSGSGFGRPTSLPWGITYPPGTEAPAGVSLHPTPIYAAAWAAVSMLLILFVEQKEWHRRVRPFALVLILHGMGRLIIEQFRGDFRGSLIAGYTVSTWISAAVVVIGLFYLVPSIRNIIFQKQRVR